MSNFVSTVRKLDLPAPSLEIIKAFKNWEKNVELLDSSRAWLNEFHNNTTNSVLHWFGVIPELDTCLQSQYQKYFNTKIVAAGGIMQSWNNSVSCLPPHSDRGRKLAINWYFDLGGEVDTVFYHELSATTETATNYCYAEVRELERHRFTNDSWYAYEVNRCHSVEGITSRRTFLSIVLIENPRTYGLEDLSNSLTGVK